MQHVDLIFPRKLGPLTYSVTPEMRSSISAGMLVEAELGASIARGIVRGPAERVPSGALKPVSSIISGRPALSAGMLSLVRWMAEHYFSTEGAALKGMLPPEFFSPTTRRKKSEKPKPKHIALPPEALIDEGSLERVRAALEAGAYKAMLLHAPSTRYEAWFAIRAAEAARGSRGIIIAAPDIEAILMMEGPLAEIFGARLALYHSKLSRGGRSEALGRMLSGEADVVLGSLAAIYAPIERASLICVLREESGLYKSESGPRASGRDAAVMRAWLEKTSVLLSSICPSVESWHNCQGRKYTLIDDSRRSSRPRVRVLGIKDDPVSKTLMDALARTLERANEQTPERTLEHTGGFPTDERRKSHGALIYINRKGHSILRCAECGYLSLCKRCNVPLVWLKSNGIERCGLCGRESSPPQTCPKCSAPALGPSGAGIERIQERLSALFGPDGILKIDSKSRGRIRLLLSDGPGLALGTRTLTRSGALSGGFSIVAVMNADSYLYAPDFRASEKAFQDFIYAADKATPGGEMFVQSRRPRQALLGFLRDFRFRAFYESMLHEREEAGYPPFARLALITVARAKTALPSEFALLDGAEALGPVQTPGKEGSARYLVKARTRPALLESLRVMTKALKQREVEVVVDPVEF